MKNKIIILLLSFSLFGLFSCYPDGTPTLNEPYYQFTSSEKQLLIQYNYKVGQVITFENQFGDQMHFKVLCNESKKMGSYSDGFFSGVPVLDFYYDSKIVRFEILENNARWADEQVIYVFSKSNNQFKNGINFPIWNVNVNTFFDEIDRPFNIKTTNYNFSTKNTLMVNNHLFDKVIVFNSGSSLINTVNYGAIASNDVNKIFFDYDFGIIQFESIDGKIWKINYPN